MIEFLSTLLASIISFAIVMVGAEAVLEALRRRDIDPVRYLARTLSPADQRLLAGAS